MGCKCKICGEKESYETLVEGTYLNYIQCECCDTIYIQDKDSKNIEYADAIDSFNASLKCYLEKYPDDFDKAVNKAYKNTINGCVEFKAVKEYSSTVKDSKSFYDLLKGYPNKLGLEQSINTFIADAKKQYDKKIANNLE